MMLAVVSYALTSRCRARPVTVANWILAITMLIYYAYDDFQEYELCLFSLSFLYAVITEMRSFFIYKGQKIEWLPVSCTAFYICINALVLLTSGFFPKVLSGKGAGTSNIQKSVEKLGSAQDFVKSYEIFHAVAIPLLFVVNSLMMMSFHNELYFEIYQTLAENRRLDKARTNMSRRERDHLRATLMTNKSEIDYIRRLYRIVDSGRLPEFFNDDVQKVNAEMLRVATFDPQLASTLSSEFINHTSVVLRPHLGSARLLPRVAPRNQNAQRR